MKTDLVSAIREKRRMQNFQRPTDKHQILYVRTGNNGLFLFMESWAFTHLKSNFLTANSSHLKFLALDSLLCWEKKAHLPRTTLNKPWLTASTKCLPKNGNNFFITRGSSDDIMIFCTTIQNRFMHFVPLRTADIFWYRKHSSSVTPLGKSIPTNCLKLHTLIVTNPSRLINISFKECVFPPTLNHGNTTLHFWKWWSYWALDL